eukprot:m.16888 g.16888  ORF g.16888 m.16888 type:complete len:514 (+) comp7259_c0_seq1:431-1972(+)
MMEVIHRTCATRSLALAAAVLSVLVMTSDARALGDCCRMCPPSTSKACGDGCIALPETCHTAPGCACNGTAPPPDPHFDHQTVPYKAKYQPISLPSASLSITPFFSPDYSIGAIVSFINSAQTSLNVFTPGLSSWSHCTSSSSTCMGCAIHTANNEKFPVFAALLNALHRGVNVRIVINNFNMPTCQDQIAPLDFLVLNNATVRWYTSTTFQHSKVMTRDKKAASISSVNWTRNSFMVNREAGVVVQGTDAGTIVAFVDQVFEADFAQGNEYIVNNTYNAANMSIITNPAQRTVQLPEGPDRPNKSPEPSPINIKDDVSLSTSPDFSYDKLMQDINATQTSFKLYIYQVTDQRLCNSLIAMHKKGINVTLLVSRAIFGSVDQELAIDCYAKLKEAGMQLQAPWQYYFMMYNHQKYWIVDGKQVTMSTGNWSPSDYPGGSGTYLPYNNQNWESINRDFTITIHNQNVLKIFDDVFEMDYLNGTTWKPPYHNSHAATTHFANPLKEYYHGPLSDL